MTRSGRSLVFICSFICFLHSIQVAISAENRAKRSDSVVKVDGDRDFGPEQSFILPLLKLSESLVVPDTDVKEEVTSTSSNLVPGTTNLATLPIFTRMTSTALPIPSTTSSPPSTSSPTSTSSTTTPMTLPVTSTEPPMVTLEDWKCGANPFDMWLAHALVFDDCPKRMADTNLCCRVHDNCYVDHHSQPECDAHFCRCLNEALGPRCLHISKQFCAAVEMFGATAHRNAYQNPPPSFVIDWTRLSLMVSVGALCLSLVAFLGLRYFWNRRKDTNEVEGTFEKVRRKSRAGSWIYTKNHRHLMPDSRTNLMDCPSVNALESMTSQANSSSASSNGDADMESGMNSSTLNMAHDILDSPTDHPSFQLNIINDSQKH